MVALGVDEHLGLVFRADERPWCGLCGHDHARRRFGIRQVPRELLVPRVWVDRVAAAAQKLVLEFLPVQPVSPENRSATAAAHTYRWRIFELSQSIAETTIAMARIWAAAAR